MVATLRRSVAFRVASAFALAMGCLAGSAQAQSTYVGVSALSDIARFGSMGIGDSSGGEAFGGAIRVGTSITDRWGVDLEFARPGEIETENDIGFLLGAPVRGAVFEGPRNRALAPATDLISSILPPSFRITNTQRYTSLTVMPWVRQSLGSRADIVYLGGLALLRTTNRTDYGPGIRLAAGLTTLDSTIVSYGSAPAVGMDVRIAMSEHLKLVPGIRLIALDDRGQTGWLTRPSVGLQWRF
jgi:hypothetical protein